MGVLEKLSRLMVGGGAAEARDTTERLTECYSGCLERAAQLARHAEMAPQVHSAEALRDLASAEEAQAGRLRDTLKAAGAAVPTTPAVTSLPTGALSHWARLVQDLELHRASARRLRELSVHFAENLPSTARLLDELCLEENVHCERLRSLIARADPQALD